MAAKQRNILLLFSHQVELSGCVDAIRANTWAPFRAELTGVGPTNAKQRTAHLLNEIEGDCLVLCLGSAGWLIPRAHPEVPIWAHEVKTESGRTMRPTIGMSRQSIEAMGWSSARLVTVSRPVTDAERATALASRVNAEMVDMESAAVVSLCLDRNVQCGAIRMVSDRANAEAVRTYRERLPKAMKTLGHGVAGLITRLHERETGRLIE